MEKTGKLKTKRIKIDLDIEIEKICNFIQRQVGTMRRHGVVIGLSGGVDSALCAALCVEALGIEKVFGLILPEKESNPESAILAKRQAEKLQITTRTIDITPILDSFGTYCKRD